MSAISGSREIPCGLQMAENRLLPSGLLGTKKEEKCPDF
jgi:hypothetical protein